MRAECSILLSWWIVPMTALGRMCYAKAYFTSPVLQLTARPSSCSSSSSSSRRYTQDPRGIADNVILDEASDGSGLGSSSLRSASCRRDFFSFTSRLLSSSGLLTAAAAAAAATTTTAAATTTTLPPFIASALAQEMDTPNSNDLTTQLFNPDGSLKDGVESKVKFRKVDFSWNDAGVGDDGLTVNRDGVNIVASGGGGDGANQNAVKITYELPLKWSDGKDGDPIYFDRSEGTNAKACKRITVYRAPGPIDINRLEQATKLGVAKAFEVPRKDDGDQPGGPSQSLDLDRLYQTDIISAKTADRGTTTYYEFDLASAPSTCGKSKENLGLGFCPYDLIYLVSATVVNDRLYCMIVECDDTKVWKLASSELKRLRSSFSVETSA